MSRLKFAFTGQTFRDIFRPLFSSNCCSVSTKGEQQFGETTNLIYLFFSPVGNNVYPFYTLWDMAFWRLLDYSNSQEW